MEDSVGTLVAGWIAPHGVVPDMPETHLSRVPKTRTGMKIAAERMVAAGPESLVLVAPHGFRAADANTVSLCRRYAIQLRTWYPWRDDELTVPGDSTLGAAILEETASEDLPAAGIIYGATGDSTYPMDWSITAPMLYMRDSGYKGSLTVVTFSGLDLASEWEFGRAVGRAVSKSSKRIGFISSSDLSHVHSADGPYGFDPIAPEFDNTIERAVRANALQGLLHLDLDWVGRAAQDGLRSILIMGGALEGLGYEAEVLAYEIFGYFGMLTAWFSPSGESTQPPM